MRAFSVGDRVIADEGAVAVVVKEDVSGRVGTVAVDQGSGYYTVRWDDFNYGNSVYSGDLLPYYGFKVGDMVEVVDSPYMAKDRGNGAIGTVAALVPGGVGWVKVRFDGAERPTDGNGVGWTFKPNQIRLYVKPEFKVGDAVRTVGETYGDKYVPAGSVGVVVDVLGGDWFTVRFDSAPWPTDGGVGKTAGWSMTAEQLEPYVEPVAEHLAIWDSMFEPAFTVGGRRFNFSDDPEQLDRISQQYAVAAEYIRARKDAQATEVPEPQEYGARVEVDDPRPRHTGRVIAYRLPGVDKKWGHPWVITYQDGYKWDAYIWDRHLAQRNPKVL